MTSPLPKEERVAIRRAVKLLKLDKLGFLWSVTAGSAGLMLRCTLLVVSSVTIRGGSRPCILAGSLPARTWFVPMRYRFGATP